eukprot:2931-Heterococcus_DN1.PRE.5
MPKACWCVADIVCIDSYTRVFHDTVLDALQVNAAVIKDDSNGKDSNGNSITGLNACRTACIRLGVTDASSTAVNSCTYGKQPILSVVQSYRAHLLRAHGAIVLQYKVHQCEVTRRTVQYSILRLQLTLTHVV